MEATDIVAGDITAEEVLSRLREYVRNDANPTEMARCVDYFALDALVRDNIIHPLRDESAMAAQAEAFVRNGMLATLYPSVHHYCAEDWGEMYRHSASRLRLFRHAIDAVARWTGEAVPDTKVHEILKATAAMDGWRPIMLPPPRDRISGLAQALTVRCAGLDLAKRADFWRS